MAQPAPLTNLDRELFFRVLDGRGELMGLMTKVRHCPRYPEILRWLIARGYVGLVLADWYKHHFAPRPHAMIRFVLEQLQGGTILE